MCCRWVITLPAWTRWTPALRYDTRMGGTATTWTLGIDNLTDKRYWKEAPYQYGHVYLYPGAAHFSHWRSGRF
jgi:iron complex outermembrane receptor protein